MRLKPIDSALYMAPERIALTPGEAFTWTLYHPAFAHPFLHPDAIVGITLNTLDSHVALQLESVSEPVDAGPFYQTHLTLSFPWDETVYPSVFEDATLSMRVMNGETIQFDGIHLGVFTPDTMHSFSVESLYGLFQNERLEGLFIRLENRTDMPLELTHAHLGFSDLYTPRANIQMTHDPFIPGQPLATYRALPLDPIAPGETRTIIVPTEALAFVDEVPVCIGFKKSTALYEECIAPFLFIQRRIHEDQLIQGHGHDSDS